MSRNFAKLHLSLYCTRWMIQKGVDKASNYNTKKHKNRQIPHTSWMYNKNAIQNEILRISEWQQTNCVSGRPTRFVKPVTAPSLLCALPPPNRSTNGRKGHQPTVGCGALAACLKTLRCEIQEESRRYVRRKTGRNKSANIAYFTDLKLKFYWYASSCELIVRLIESVVCTRWQCQ